MIDAEDRNEVCWITGIYDDDCDCSCCQHKDKCSGYDDEDEEDK